MSDIKKAAVAMRDAMTLKTREDDASFYTLKDGAPPWMRDVAREAHGDFMPDDYKYSFIYQCLEAIAESDDDPSDAVREIEPDCYTSDLTRWLASDVRRVAYLDEAVSEWGADSHSILGAAQYLEIQEVGGLLIQALEGVDIEDDA